MSWLRTPVAPATVSHDLGLHLMRFVMMEHLLPPDEVLAFLQNLADALAALTAQLEQYAAGAADLTNRHPRLALDHGLAVHRASLRWAEHDHRGVLRCFQFTPVASPGRVPGHRSRNLASRFCPGELLYFAVPRRFG